MNVANPVPAAKPASSMKMLQAMVGIGERPTNEGMNRAGCDYTMNIFALVK